MIIGIVCEYNPFHNGHLYQINKVKEMYPNCLLIAIMSGNFVQRGEFSILDKFDKAKIATNCGIDLVVELPVFYATQGADMFAHGALKLANLIGCNAICFGAEHDDINFFYRNIELTNKKEYNNKVIELLKQGLNYPTATSEALNLLGGDNINQPNDILALRYIKEIIDNKYDIKPIIIKRTSEFNDIESDSNIISANNIRNRIKNGMDIKRYVPSSCYDILKNKNIKNMNDFFTLIKYAIIINKDNLCDYLEINEGLANRINKWIYKSDTLDEFINNVKSKNETLNKINRVILHILLNIKKDDKYDDDEYDIDGIRVLGFNDTSRKHLKKIKKDVKLINKFSDLSDKEKTQEIFLNYIYNITL